MPFEGRFSLSTLISACACADLARSVENDPGGSAVGLGWSEVEPGRESSAGHGSLVVAAAIISARYASVTKYLPCNHTNCSRPA